MPEVKGSTALVYLPKLNGGQRMRSVENEYNLTKTKVAIKLHENKDAAMDMVRKFEERAETLAHRSLVKEAVKYAELGLRLQFRQPYVPCTTGNMDLIQLH